jgi:twitching motility protein PilT
MALFGNKRSTAQTLEASGWANPQEKMALLEDLRKNPPKAVEVAPLLWHREADIRKTAAAVFLPHADEPGIKALLQGLNQQGPQVRSALAPMLAQLPAALLRTALEGLFEEGTPQARRMAWETALSIPGPTRAQYLKRAVFEAPTALRIKAIQELIHSEDPRANLDILIRLAKERDAEIGPVALESVATVRDPKVLELMLDRLAEGDEASRTIADGYLRKEAASHPDVLRQDLLDVLTRGSDETRRIAVGILLDSNPPEKVVHEVLGLCNRVAGWMRSRIIEALRAAGEPVLRAAVKLMGHSDEGIRTSAIMMLAEGFDDKRLVDPFCAVLKDPDWWLRVTACQVLGNLAEERAVPHLVKMLQDEDTRWAAVDALAQIGAPSALQPLSQLLRDGRQEVRMEVLQAFARFDDPRLLRVVQNVRDQDPDPTVRTRAGEVLREMSRRLGQGEVEGGGKVAYDKLANPLDRLLARVREMGCSDLHLTVGEPPLIRLHGVLQRMEKMGKMDAEQTSLFLKAMLDEQQQKELEEHGSLDFCYVVDGVGRYRANAYIQRLGLCASFRVIPAVPPTFQDLRLPEQLRELIDYHQGIIIISGPAGCGKSTTLTALVNLINDTKPVHILTLEDPIEFVHTPKLALVNQRQTGRDTKAFHMGLRAALREDPDVIVVGELRDTESIRLALEAAETGHVVITTLHTTSAVQTIDRLVSSFPSDEQSQVRTALSESMKYIVCQRLLPRRDGQGRVAVFEVLKGTMSIGNMIRKSETFQIPGLMQIGRKLGMRTLDQALASLVEAELISPETAWRNAEKQDTFAPLCDPEVLEREEEALV